MRVIFLLITLLGLGILLDGSYSLWQGHQARYWQAVDGEILSSRVGVCHGKSTTYFPDISYRYTVAGQMHLGRSVRFGPRQMSREDSEALVRRYPQGARVAVFVNPQAPENAILDREHLSSDLVWQLLVGGMLMLAGGFLTLVIRHIRR